LHFTLENVSFHSLSRKKFPTREKWFSYGKSEEG
jgi:hypothetical protein